MHHYRCQNVYISITASERIVDTLEFFPHNYQMPQLSSTDRLLMAAKETTDALQNPHPEFPFASVGDDTIAALTDLAAIFKLKLRQTPSPATQAAPATVVQRQSLAPSSNQILNSPMPISRQTRSQTAIHTQDIPNVPLPPRVVTPRTIRQPPPRVPTGSQGLSPRNLSEDDFCGMDSSHMAISLGHTHWSQRHQANAVIQPVTGKEIECSALMKDPRLQPLWTRTPLTTSPRHSKEPILVSSVKLLPLPQPPVRARTDARTNPSAQRATQLRSVLARVYAVSIQNQTTTTVP
jgi:hypothetical protein